MSPSSPDPLSWWQQMMQQAAPIPGLALPTLDIDEIDRRIREYQAVEGWLQMNLASIQMMRQTLEMQRAALSTWNLFQSKLQEAATTPPPAAGAAAAPSTSFSESTPSPALANPFEWMKSWWQAAQQAVQTGAAEASAAMPQAAGASTPAAEKGDGLKSEAALRKRTRGRRSAAEKPEKP